MTANRRPLDPSVLLVHGAGGRAMRALVERLFVEPFAADVEGGVGLAQMDDGAALPLADRFLVVTTDMHVVDPPFFPGGDIGRLAVSGTVNDLAVMGAVEVLALTAAIAVEAGFPTSDLERIAASMRAACHEASAHIVTGDTKVLGKGELDGIVINTTGIGLTRRPVPDAGLRPGDRIVLTGPAGSHGFAVLAARGVLDLDCGIASDTAPLNGLIAAALAAGGEGVTAMKDPTRGGVASALHEMAHKSGVGITIDESAVPVLPAVRAASEIVGIDPLHVANEGIALIGVRPDRVEAVLAALRSHPRGRDAAVVGSAGAERPGQVRIDTGFGLRLLAEPEGEPLPRIC